MRPSSPSGRRAGSKRTAHPSGAPVTVSTTGDDAYNAYLCGRIDKLAHALENQMLDTLEEVVEPDRPADDDDDDDDEEEDEDTEDDDEEDGDDEDDERAASRAGSAMTLLTQTAVILRCWTSGCRSQIKITWNHPLGVTDDGAMEVALLRLADQLGWSRKPNPDAVGATIPCCPDHTEAAVRDA